MSERIKRVVAVYQRQGHQHVKSIEISTEAFQRLSTGLSNSDDIFFYDCYPLVGGVLKETQAILGDKLPQGSFDYFLECERV